MAAGMVPHGQNGSERQIFRQSKIIGFSAATVQPHVGRLVDDMIERHKTDEHASIRGYGWPSNPSALSGADQLP